MSTPDFSNITKSVEVTTETTREYTFAVVVGEPSLIVSAANDVNEDYQNLRYQLGLEDGQKVAAKPRGKATAKITVEQLKEGDAAQLEFERKLIGGACVRGWGKAPIDVSGKEVEFTPENAMAFIRALPPFLFIPLRNFVENIYNFLPERVTEEEAQQLGNS
jgi:hypothetical protein